jgi:hypothetical protein
VGEEDDVDKQRRTNRNVPAKRKASAYRGRLARAW